jgi:flavin reductase ActVB
VITAAQTELFREAMASFPSGVTLVTTADPDGTPWGFTATAFCSLSAEPPLVLVCLAKSAQCHPVFLGTEAFAVHIIHSAHTDLAQRFATRGADKFGTGEFATNDRGIPVLPGASARLECTVHDRHDGGDHTILVGRVHTVDLGDDPPVVYFKRIFHTL